MAGYKNMLAQERKRLLHKNVHGLELFKALAIIRAEAGLDRATKEQSDFLALRWLKSCLECGILPPPWVADRILNIVDARYKKQIKSLDVGFGFAEEGRGKRVPAVHKFLFDDRNHWIGKCVLSLIDLGQTPDVAIYQVAHFFMHKKKADWNQSAFDLTPIRDLNRGVFKDSCAICDFRAADEETRLKARDVEMRTKEYINTLYSKWLKDNPGFKIRNHPYRKKVRAAGKAPFSFLLELN
jgi:hypothetical protein